jgi:hypothetical protein
MKYAINSRPTAQSSYPKLHQTLLQTRDKSQPEIVPCAVIFWFVGEKKIRLDIP